MLEVSEVSKIPANKRITLGMLFPSFQDICLGCCTVAAQKKRSTGLDEESLCRLQNADADLRVVAEMAQDTITPKMSLAGFERHQ